VDDASEARLPDDANNGADAHAPMTKTRRVVFEKSALRQRKEKVLRGGARAKALFFFVTPFFFFPPSYFFSLLLPSFVVVVGQKRPKFTLCF